MMAGTPATYENIRQVPVVGQLSGRDGWSGIATVQDAYMGNCFVDKVGDMAYAVKRSGLAAVTDLSACSPALPSYTCRGFGGTSLVQVGIYGSTALGLRVARFFGTTLYGATVAIPSYTDGSGNTYLPPENPYRIVQAPGTSGLFLQSDAIFSYNNVPTCTLAACGQLGDPTAIPYVPSLCELNGAYYVLTVQGRVLSTTNVLTGFPALNYVTLGTPLGEAVCMVRHLNYLIAFQTGGSTAYYDAGISPGAPIAPVTNAPAGVGMAKGAAQTAATFADTLFWLSGSTAAGLSVWRMSGLQPEKVSTAEVDRLITSFYVASYRATLGTYVPPIPARGLCFEAGGHPIYLLTLPTYTSGGVTYPGFSLAYNIALGHWSIWTQSVGGVEGEMRLIAGGLVSEVNKLIFGDDFSGQTVSLSEATYQDLSQVLTMTVQTDLQAWGNQRTKFIPATYVQTDTLSSSVQVSWTDDDYTTFSTPQTVSTATPKKQLIRCGSTLQRAWKLTHTDNTPMRIYGLEVEVHPGAL